MNRTFHRMPTLLTAVLLLCASPAFAADTKPESNQEAAVADFSVLPGQWVRPDGGYTITIVSVAADGQLDATYSNQAPLPFAVARASRDDGIVNVFLELRAGGYNGSTYNLTFNPATDTLQGVYYQAVAQQSFDIYFERVR
jgi:hypothetical protein